MAEKDNIPQIDDEAPTGLQALWQGFLKQPALYIGSAVLVVAVAVASWLYSHSVNAQREKEAGDLARAVLSPDSPEARLLALEALSDNAGSVEAETLYMLGETAFDLREYDKARNAFERVRTEYPEFDFAPDAVEGLGAILEAEGQYSTARQHYSSIRETWPQSFASRRQAYNIGRAYLSEGDHKAAIEAFREQLTLFPGSQIAMSAQRELDRLRASRPELFESAATPLGTTPASETPINLLDITPLPERNETVEIAPGETPEAASDTESSESVPGVEAPATPE